LGASGVDQKARHLAREIGAKPCQGGGRELPLSVIVGNAWKSALAALAPANDLCL
jgi:hypothetical protein